VEIRTQQVIIEAVSNAWQGLAEPLKREVLGHREGIALLQKLLAQKLLSFELISASDPVSEFPDEVRNIVYAWDAKRFKDQLALVDTEDKLQALLSSAAEPRPEQLEQVLTLIKTSAIRVRAILERNVNVLPTDPGGRSKKLSLRDEADIRQLIKTMREPGVTLAEIYRSLAKRYEVSETTIKRIWLDGQISMARSIGKRRKMKK
jgi:hypothetical protein